MEIPIPEVATCVTPPLPTGEELLSSLDPLPEAVRTNEYRFYGKLWPEPDDDEQESRRRDLLAKYRSFSVTDLRPQDKLQDHRSVRLRVRYDCKANLAVVFPHDGADLVAFGAWTSNDRMSIGEIASSNYEFLKHTKDGWRLLPPEETPR
jgi:hypothetical protein